MNVLGTFYLLFKTNADDLVKGNEKALKSTQATDKALREQKKSTDEVGKSFVQMAESLGGVVTAFLSLDAIKGGLANAQRTTAGLQMQSKWLGQNADDLAAFGNATVAAGGTVEAFQGTIKRLHDQYAQAGIVASVPMIMQNLVNTAREWDRLGYSLQQKETFGLRLGLDEGTILTMSEGADAMQRLIDERKKLLDLTPADTGAARSIQTEWDKTTITFTKLFNKINTDLAPILKDLFSYIRDFVSWLAGHPHWAEALIVAIAALGVLLSGGIIVSMIGLGTAAAGAAAPFLALAAAIGAVAAAANKLPGNFFESGDWLGRQANKLLGRGDADGYLPGKRPSAGSAAGGKPLGNAKQVIDYFVSQGYSPAQAAGIAANAQAESGFNPNATNGSHFGIFQWSQKRRSAILNALDIDVANASIGDQLKAANWELNQSGLSNALKQSPNSGSAAALFSNQFEVPSITQGGLALEAAKRARIAASYGQEALNGASSSPFNAGGGPWGSTSSSNTNVKIDSINVQTQATDATGIASAIGTSLKSSLRSATSNFDDGILA